VKIKVNVDNKVIISKLHFNHLRTTALQWNGLKCGAGVGCRSVGPIV